jgi:hypothetical protein
MPIRIQRQRTRGWKAPDGAVYVGRPSMWGNPFAASHHDRAHHPDVPIVREYVWNAADAVRMFRDYAKKLDVTPLRGKDLMCWCALDQPCHADVLLELANASGDLFQCEETTE